MPDLELAAAETSFAVLRPVPDSAWPPASRPLETDPQVAARLTVLGAEMDRLPVGVRPTLFQALCEPAAMEVLRAALAQLGGARLFQLIGWIADHHTPEGSRLIASLTAGDSPDALALRAVVNAVTCRAALDRMFSPERMAAVEAASALAVRQVH